jgi:hypothetical protein
MLYIRAKDGVRWIRESFSGNANIIKKDLFEASIQLVREQPGFTPLNLSSGYKSGVVKGNRSFGANVIEGVVMADGGSTSPYAE